LGEGRISEPNDGYADIDIPRDILIEDFDDPIVAIVESTYPAFMDNYKSYDYLRSRAILASTIEVVDQINNHILDMMTGLFCMPIYIFIYSLLTTFILFTNYIYFL
jgi:ATP-dependent DNA helicase PIF1